MDSAATCDFTQPQSLSADLICVRVAVSRAPCSRPLAPRERVAMSFRVRLAVKTRVQMGPHHELTSPGELHQLGLE